LIIINPQEKPEISIFQKDGYPKYLTILLMKKLTKSPKKM